MQFSTYMNEWLYGEEGYYKNFKAIGKSGDFYTAVSTSSFFGASIANYSYTLIIYSMKCYNSISYGYKY